MDMYGWRSLAQKSIFMLAWIVAQGCFYDPDGSSDDTDGSMGAVSTTGTGAASTTSGTATDPPTTTSTGEVHTATTDEILTSMTNTTSTGETSAGETSTGGTSTGETSTDETSTGESSTTTSDTSTTSADGTSTTTGEPEPLPDAAVLQLSFSPIKQFDFAWSQAAGADYYQLLERPEPSAPYGQIGADIFGLSVSRTMPLHLRFGASYVLRACNDGGCTDSAPVEVVDSLATSIGYFKASNTEADDNFGHSVALSADGSTLAVAAYGEDSAASGIGGDQSSNASSVAGAVYVFVRVDGTWSQQAYIKASNTGVSDYFGYSLALSADGDSLAVAAYGEDSAATGVDGDQASNAAPDSGAVYVFVRADEVWTQQAYVKASNPGAGDLFGYSIALSADGETLAVGALYEQSAATGINGNQGSNSAEYAGAAYVFVRSDSTWAQQAYIKGSNTEASDRFGCSVALSADGDTLVVGAYGEDSAAVGIGGMQSNNSIANSGALYVFVRATDTWMQQAYVKASNTGSGDDFGFSLALSADGDTLAVGAPYEASAAVGIDGLQADDSAASAGAVYMFVRINNVWSQQSYVKASNTGALDNFGMSVALSADGDVLAVGAPFEASAATGINGDQSGNSIVGAGAVYLFLRSNDAWSQRSYVKASVADTGDSLGFSVALAGDGDTLAVGAYRDSSAAIGIGGDPNDNSASNAGAVGLY